MLTKKVWNTLSKQTRETIIMFVEGDGAVNRDIYKSLINENYNHDFDFDQKGRRLKAILTQCTLKTDGTIMIVNIVNPTYAPKSSTKPVKKAPVEEAKRSVWYIDYDDKDGDLCHIWCEAESREAAIDYLYREYWNVGEIIRVYKEK